MLIQQRVPDDLQLDFTIGVQHPIDQPPLYTKSSPNEAQPLLVQRHGGGQIRRHIHAIGQTVTIAVG